MRMRTALWSIPACALALSCASGPKPAPKVEDPAEHTDGRGLPARAGNPNGETRRVEEVGEKPRPGSDRGADAARGLHVGNRLLNRSRCHQDLVGALHAAAILRMQQHAMGAQKIKSFAVATLVERAVGALDPVAPAFHDQSERGHSAPADAAKKVLSRLGHRQNVKVFVWLNRSRCATPFYCRASASFMGQQSALAL